MRTRRVRSSPAVAILAAAALAGARIAAPNRPQRWRRQGSRGAVPVDVELVLAVDVSYSMDPEEQALQREGYMAAITSREFLQALQAGHARQDRHDLFRMGRHAPSADHRAVAADRRAGSGRWLCRRHRARALHARLAHLDLGRAAVRRAAVRGQRLSRRPPRDRRLRRRRQQQRPAGRGDARRGAGQGHHHQRPADHAQAAEPRARWISTSSTSTTRTA